MQAPTRVMELENNFRIRSDEEMVLGNWFEGLHTQYPWPWPEIKVWSYGRKAIKLGRQDIDSKNRID